MSKLSKKKHAQLWSHVENEGFGYYMLDYGPDLDAISKLGFDKKEVKKAIELFRSIESKINEGQDFAEDSDY